MTPTPVLGEVSVLDDVGPPRRGRAYPLAAGASALLLPAALLLGGLVLWPVLRTLYVSVRTPDAGLGVDNFRQALAAPGAGAAFWRTLWWALLVPAVVTVLGYLLAVASRRWRQGRLVRLVLLAPIALPLVVTGVTFRLVYDPGRGPATQLGALLLGRSAQAGPQFLGPALVTVAVMSAFVWAWVGLAVLVFRAALAALPAELADAVSVYGGTRRAQLWHAQWRPLLLRTAAVVFTLVALATVRSFDLVLMMAPGASIDEASVLAVQVWQTGRGTTSGEGAALGVVWLAVVATGVLVAAPFVRQAWPAPRLSPVPEPAAAAVSPARRAARAAAAVAGLFWLVPVVVLLIASLHGRVDAATGRWWSAAPTGRSYRDVLAGGDLLHTMGFTLALAGTATAVVLLVALVAAYPLAWLTGPPAQLTGVLLTAAAIMPVQAIAGPINEVLGFVLSSGSVRGLILVHVAMGVPIAVLVLRNAFADLPAAQVRRARVAGRRWWNTLWRLARHNPSAVIAVAVLQFVQVWNDFAVGLLFSGADAAPLGLYLYGQSRYFVANTGVLAASSAVGSLLPVVLVLLARRHLIAGLVSGGGR
ncbi:ABC transporter permease subunit [Plantactinospora sp. KBS50]|uniref:ABC transporter permease subunit n=1 Tax=Plantactinospora sp. KBS50 TaxID=2024580 RepID=UPI000BAAB3A2|nr:ABC transporter permease subunit [Plantactinospora sp. KBS50]ASW55196.1 hypothetical protein CIK06_14960 [Plantactinospora sp. KBS50]